MLQTQFIHDDIKHQFGLYCLTFQFILMIHAAHLRAILSFGNVTSADFVPLKKIILSPSTSRLSMIYPLITSLLKWVPHPVNCNTLGPTGGRVTGAGCGVGRVFVLGGCFLLGLGGCLDRFG